MCPEQFVNIHSCRLFSSGEVEDRVGNFFFSLLCVYKERTQFLFLPTQTTGDDFLTWCYWLLLIFWVPCKENSLSCFLLHLCWGLTMSLSCWLSTAFHIWLCSVPGCILYMYIVLSKDIWRLLHVQSAYAAPLSTHGSAPSHTYVCPVLWTGAPTWQFIMGWMKLLILDFILKKSIWACEKQYLITVNLWLVLWLTSVEITVSVGLRL